MPSDLLVPGLGVLGNVVGAVAQGTANRAQRRYNDRVAWRERVWALEDWNRQNEYNSPASQMARLKAAGLNPNLVYGHGADAQSSQMPRGVNSNSYSPQAPRFDLLGPAMAYFQVRAMNKEMELKDAQISTAWSDASLRNAQILATLQGVKGADFDLSQRQRLADTTFNTAQAHLDNLQKSTQVMLNRDEREAAMNSSNLREAASRIVSMRIQNAKTEQERENLKKMLSNIEQDTRLKKADADLREKGIYPGDPTWLRMLADYLISGKKDKTYPMLPDDAEEIELNRILQDRKRRGFY